MQLPSLTTLPIDHALAVRGRPYRVIGHAVDLPDAQLPAPGADQVLHYYVLLPEDEQGPALILEIWPRMFGYGPGGDHLTVWEQVGHASGAEPIKVAGTQWLADGEPMATEYLVLQGDAEPLMSPVETWLQPESADEQRELWLLGSRGQFTMWLPEELSVEQVQFGSVV